VPSKTQRPTATTAFLVKHLGEQLEQYSVALPSLSLRQRVIRLIDLQASFRKLGKALVTEAGFTTGSARARIRQYLIAHAGQVVDGTELAVIGGISEYARRIRELREEGLTILTGPESDPSTDLALRPDQYLLVKKPPQGKTSRSST
jgi:hypothetical protein